MTARFRRFVLLLPRLLLLPALYALNGPAAARPPFPAGRYRLDPQHARITWSVDHLGFSIYRGLIPQVQGSLLIDPALPQAARLEATMAMAKLTSLDEALDRRLRSAQFFDVARYPTAGYRALGLVMTGPDTAQLRGDLTLCGVSHPVTMNVRFQRAGPDPVDGVLTLGFEGTAIVRRSLFGIGAYAPLVGDDVALQLEAEFVPDRVAAP